MVKYNPLRVEQQTKKYQDYCQRKKIKPGVYQRISWELMTRGIIPEDGSESLDINRLALERIFIDLKINSMESTNTPYEQLQTLEDIFNYAINHPKNRGKTSQIPDSRKINDFLKKL